MPKAPINPIQEHDYRKILWEDYRRRHRANPSYSLRVYARDLGISPSRLTEVFQRKNGLSVRNAGRIAQRLNLDEQDRRIFQLSVESQHASSPKLRETAHRELERAIRKPKISKIKRDEFLLIASWHHFAIVELLAMKDFDLSPKTAAEALNISQAEAKDAIDRLQRLGWIVKSSDGNWVTETAYRTFYTEIPSKAARSFHSRLLQRAEKSIERQTSQERELHSLLLAFDPKRLKDAKERLNRFCEEFNEEFCESDGGAQEVYALTTQFFRLTSPKETRR